MKHGFMPDHVFNVGAVVIAKTFLECGLSIEQSSADLAEKYRRGYEDDNFEDLWIIVAKALIESDDEPRNLWARLHLLLYYVSKYNCDGTKRKRRLLNGAKFNTQREPISDRVERFGISYARFLSLLAVGNVPLPPKGWTFH